MSRDNATWLAALRGNGADPERTLAELRAVLLRRLRQAFRGDVRLDEALLEDAVQDALLRILDRLEQFSGRSRFTTWATSIAIRIAMTELRRSRWKDVSLDTVLADAEYVPNRAIDGQDAPDVHTERRALLEALQHAIQTELTDRQRTALLAELKGMPQDEIARRLGSNRNAVYKLTHDARKKLKQGLEAAGYRAEDVVAVTAK